MKAHDFIDEIEEDLIEDIYSKTAEDYEDEDTISAAEAGFMQGYLSA